MSPLKVFVFRCVRMQELLSDVWCVFGGGLLKLISLEKWDAK